MSNSAAPRGRIDKRQAILDAAITVFARQGYAQTCVQEIAAEAGVAKPTVYNHLSDKANLFRHAMAAAAEVATAENLAVIERLRDHDGNVREALEDVAYRLLQCYCAERSWALRRLLYTEVVRFPDLLEVFQGQRVKEALADRLARLSLSGRLRAGDPAEAAEQFIALLTGPAETRSRLGTREIPDAELRTVAEAAVRSFLRAFATP